MELQAKNFNNRQELEAKVSSLMGLTTELKADTISGTKEELQKLQLGNGAIFWGIKCVETDFVEPKKTEKIDRGEVVKPKLDSINIKNSIDV